MERRELDYLLRKYEEQTLFCSSDRFLSRYDSCIRGISVFELLTSTWNICVARIIYVSNWPLLYGIAMYCIVFIQNCCLVLNSLHWRLNHTLQIILVDLCDKNNLCRGRTGELLSIAASLSLRLAHWITLQMHRDLSMIFRPQRHGAFSTSPLVECISPGFN